MRQMVRWWRIDALPGIPSASSGQPRGRKWANPSKRKFQTKHARQAIFCFPSPPMAAVCVLHSIMWMVPEGVKKRKGEVGRRLFLSFWLREALWGLWPSPSGPLYEVPSCRIEGVEPLRTIHYCQISPSSFQKAPESRSFSKWRTGWQQYSRQGVQTGRKK